MAPALKRLIVVIVAAAIAAALAWPAVQRFNERRAIVRAHRDVETIRAALFRFYEDNTFFPLWDRAPAGEAPQLGRVDLLVGPGRAPVGGGGTPWTSARVGTLGDVLVANAPSFATWQDSAGIGWRGPYLNPPPDADPWSHRYVVNIGAIAVEGDEPRMKYAVWILSAGPNGVIDTTYAQPIAAATLGGDDIGVRLQ